MKYKISNNLSKKCCTEKSYREKSAKRLSNNLRRQIWQRAKLSGEIGGSCRSNISLQQLPSFASSSSQFKAQKCKQGWSSFGLNIFTCSSFNVKECKGLKLQIKPFPVLQCSMKSKFKVPIEPPFNILVNMMQRPMCFILVTLRHTPLQVYIISVQTSEKRRVAKHAQMPFWGPRVSFCLHLWHVWPQLEPCINICLIDILNCLFVHSKTKPQPCQDCAE